MTKRIITLTTDFGTSDHFAGTMKGVILRDPQAAQIVDITHDVQPFEIADGAFTIAQTYRYFPKNTIHVIVVDPGVGSTRRPLLAESGGHYFVAPDNGVLSMVFGERKTRVWHVTNKRYFLHPVSRTFHGRDVFAPVAAHLAAGIPPVRFGKRIEDYLRLTFAQPVPNGKNTWTGAILKVDRFGNLATNLHIDNFADVKTRPFELHIGPRTLSRLALTFTECEPGDIFVIVGSSGYLEIASNQSSAAQTLGCGAGTPVELKIF